MLLRSTFCHSPNTKIVSNCVYTCPCGYYGDSLKPCTPFGPRARRGETACAHALVTKYQKRISGPLLDRIDTACRIEVPRVDYEKLSGDRVSESSESIRTRVQVARERQLTRFSNNGSSDIVCNADMRVGRLGNFAGCSLKAPH